MTVCVGLVSGVGLRPLHLSPDAILLVSYPGELFMRLLKLMILPLVIASLIAGKSNKILMLLEFQSIFLLEKASSLFQQTFYTVHKR
jgi:Na+/H+-dicarboxylate symporter